MTGRQCITVIAFAIVNWPIIAAADEPDDDGGMRDMTVRAHSMQLRLGAELDVLRVAENPVFRYSDAARETIDGTLWLWERASEPLALLCLFREPREGFEWNYELVLLSDGPLHVSGRRDWSWRPVRKAREWRALEGPAAAARDEARLVQLKGLARQFTATEHLDGETYRLRLLPNPVHRYSRPDAGVTDGAMFLFAYGTNPEIVMQVEAVDESPGWRVAFAQLAAADLTVTLDETAVWDAERVLEWDEQAEYFSHYGPDPLEQDSNTGARSTEVDAP